MKDFNGKVAVITGAASGIGRALALACAHQGMRVVLSDLDAQGLQETIAMLDTPSLVVPCDVSKADEVERLAQDTYRHFGATDLLFNNAGVALLGPVWTTTLEDWQWVMGINLMGVVHGVRSFVPRMLEQKTECHIVNTASVAGFLSFPAHSVYCVSKHAVVTLTECLYHDLRQAQAPIGVSLLCPAFVKTGIGDSARHRPAALAATNPEGETHIEKMRAAIRAGKLSADDIAQITLDAVQANRFYILPHTKIKGAIETRMRDILDERAPTNTLPA